MAYAQLIKWYEVQLKKLGVKVVLNTAVAADDPVLKSADAIFVATGSRPTVPHIPGIDNKKVIDVVDVHKNGMPEGERVVICGGGLSACDNRHRIRRQGPQDQHRRNAARRRQRRDGRQQDQR